jgi:hypothetical protein
MEWIVAGGFLALIIFGGGLCYWGWRDPAIRVDDDRKRRRHSGMNDLP